MHYLQAFITGGIICALSQILIDKTKLTPARILVSYVVLGVILTGLGLYQPLVDWGGAGATVPLLGFGYSLAKGVAKGRRDRRCRRHRGRDCVRLPVRTPLQAR